MLLAMFIIGAVIGNLTLLGFMALSEEAADTYGILISYPLMFIPPMLYAAYQSRKNGFFEWGISIDSSNFGKFSGVSIALAVSVSALAAGFALDPLNAVMVKHIGLFRGVVALGIQAARIVENIRPVLRPVFQVAQNHHLGVGPF